MYLRKTVVTALKIKNWLLGVLSVITVLVCGFYIVSEFVDYRDDPGYAWEAVDMKFSIVMVCVGLAVLLAVIISARCIGNAAFYSSYFEGDLDGEVSFADLAKVVGKSEGTVRRQLSFYSAVYMTGFGFSQDGRGVQLNSKTCLCECRSCGAHIEKKIYFTGECPYCHSSDLHAKVLSGEHFYSISNEAQSGTGNADFYRSGAFNAKSVLIFVLVVLGTLVVSVMAIFSIMQISYYFDEEDQKKMLEATTWAPADNGYFRGGGYSSRFVTKYEMPITMIRLNLVKGLGPFLQIAEGWTVALPDEVTDTLWKRTDYTWPCTWFAPRVDHVPGSAFCTAYDMMRNWGANHGSSVYGHVGADLITLASMLRIPVCMHNVPEEKIYRPAVWGAFGMDKEGADFRACQTFGPLYKAYK